MQSLFCPRHLDFAPRNILTGNCYGCGEPLGQHLSTCQYCPPELLISGIDRHWRQIDQMQQAETSGPCSAEWPVVPRLISSADSAILHDLGTSWYGGEE